MRSIITVNNKPEFDQENDFIKNHLKWLDSDYQLTFFGGSKCRGKVMESHPDCDFVDVGDFFSFDWLNELMISEWFWQRIPNEEILVVQDDSGILKTGLEKFFEWDYVGAIWEHPKWGGNGGISIRKKSIMIKCIQMQPRFGSFCNEDGYFCDIMHKFGVGNLAPRRICKEFGVETVFTLGTYTYHKINGYLTPEQCEQILNQYNGDK